MGAVLVVFMVRPRGLEPPQDCSYQPLKLARLPFRHDRLSWLFNGISPKKLERVKRIELSQSAWKAEVLPLNYTRIFLWPSDVLLSHLRTTLGAKELNFCVRYGNRCALLALITRPSVRSYQSHKTRYLLLTSSCPATLASQW